jgi:hypothetical protein
MESDADDAFKSRLVAFSRRVAGFRLRASGYHSPTALDKDGNAVVPRDVPAVALNADDQPR